MKTRKSSAYYNAIKPDRDAWRDKRPNRCMYCGVPGTAWPLEIHEIERRSQAPKRWWHRCNALLLCQTCHAGPFAAMDHARQLAVKLLRDPEHFDLSRWLEIKHPDGRAPDRVTLGDIARHLELMED